MKNTSEFVLKMLTTSNKKDVERDTGIPADRIYKWLKGKGNPKPADLEILYKYFQSGTISNSNINVTNKTKPIGNRDSVANLSGISDSRPVNHQLGYDENSTFPEKGKAPSNEWKMLYFNQQEQIRLLNKQVELLNQIIQR